MEAIQKIVKTLAWGLLLLIVFIAIITVGNISLLSSLFSWIHDVVVVTIGIQGPLAKAVTCLFVGVIIFLPLGKIALSLTPIPQQDKGSYRALIFGCFFVFWLFVFFGSKDTYFNVKTGQPLKYYSVSPSGSYKFYSEPGYDPLTGDALKIVTKDIVLKSQNLTSKPHSSNSSSYQPNSSSSNSDYRPKISNVPVEVQNVSSSHLESPPVNDNAPPSQVSPELSYNKKTYSELCQTSFINRGPATIIIADVSKREVLRILPKVKLTIDMKPGKYYFKPSTSKNWNPLLIPRKQSWSISVASR